MSISKCGVMRTIKKILMQPMHEYSLAEVTDQSISIVQVNNKVVRCKADPLSKSRLDPARYVKQLLFEIMARNQLNSDR